MNKDDKTNLNKGIIDYKVLLPSMIIIVIISILFAIFESTTLDFLNETFEVIVDNFSWGYIWYAIIVFIASLYFSFSKYGNVVVGDPNDKPMFNLFQYASILVATGLGASMMRVSIIQWTDIAADPPFGIEPESTEALIWGTSYSMFMWSFLIFSIFVVAAPAIAYTLHVRKKPLLRISEACRAILGDKITDGVGGVIIDIIFVLSILSGASVTIGFSTPIVTSSLAYLLNIEETFGLTMIVIIIWVVIFTISAYLGIEKGIKNLSTFNMYIGGILALLVLLLGPTVFILTYFTDSFNHVIKHYTDMSLYTEPFNMGGISFMERNTVFWIAYNATWGMLGSVFIAKISRGRTIKEMILTYLIAPTIVSWIFTGVLNGVGIHRFVTGEIPIMEMKENDPMSAIPEILGSLPLGTLLILLYIVVSSIFLATTLDSTSYTIASYTTTKNMSEKEPPRLLVVFIAGVLAIIAIILLWIGGLAPLEVMSGLIGIPIIFVQFLTIFSAKKMMDNDKAWKYNVRKNKG